MLNNGSNPLLARAVAAIAARCDGAYAVDGAGFNGRDAGFGRSLANQPEETWSPKQRFFAWKMMRTYRAQLAGLGIDYDEIPVPPDLEQIEVEFQKKREVERKTSPRKIDLKGTTAEVWFPYDPELVTAVKGVTGRRFTKLPSPHWTIPVTDISAGPILRLADDHDLQLSENDRAKLEQLAGAAKQTAGLSEAMAVEGFEVRPGLGGTLRPFQAVAVAYMAAKQRVLCGDEMGLGKTIEALATLHHLQAYPALIVVPATLKPNWVREAAKWLPPKVRIGQLEGTRLTAANRRVLERCDVVIVNYDVLGWSSGAGTKLTPHLQAKKWAALVADEVHYAKNHKAQRSLALKALAKDAPMVFGLTGTPILNRPQELVNILGILGRLNDMGGFWQFLSACGVSRGRWGGLEFNGTHQMLESVHAKLRATCMIRRKKEQVLTELPPKVRATVPLAIDNRQEYRKATQDFLAWLRGEEGQEAAAKAEQAEHLVRIEKLKSLAAHGKLNALKDWVTNFLESGEKLVLFAHHRALQAELLGAFPGSCRLIADDSVEKRDEEIQRFQTGPAQLMVASLKAGGVGVTLTAASNVAFAELGWTPGDMDQAEDRCHRMGQLDSVTAWYLLAEDTIEETIAELIDKKRIIVTALSDGDAVQGEKGGIMKALLSRLANDAQGV